MNDPILINLNDLLDTGEPLFLVNHGSITNSAS